MNRRKTKRKKRKIYPVQIFQTFVTKNWWSFCWDFYKFLLHVIWK